jgi:hypothetical protein
LISIAEIKSKPSEEFDLLGLLGAEWKSPDVLKA